MIVNLNRTRVILLFFCICCIYFILYNYKELKNTEFTSGMVIEKYILKNYEGEVKTETYLENEKIYNAILFPTTSKIEVTVLESEEEFKIGTKIPLRYHTENPKQVFIYSFFSFWINSLLVVVIVMVVVLAFCFAFIENNEKIILQFGKGGLRLIKNNKEESKKDLMKLEE